MRQRIALSADAELGELELPPYLSDRLKHLQRMNRTATHDAVETIAVFGTGSLVRTAEGKFAFRGGSNGDRADAIEWVSMFAPEIVISMN